MPRRGYVPTSELTPEEAEKRRAIQRERSRRWYADNKPKKGHAPNYIPIAQRTPEDAERVRKTWGKARKRYYQTVKADPEKYAKKLAYNRNWFTGFTPELEEAVLAFQENKCGICQAPLESRKRNADHCHDSNTPRGILCHTCNIVEGFLNRLHITPREFAERMEHYLANPPVKRFKEGR